MSAPEPGFRVRGEVHGLRESRPLADWVRDIREAVALDLRVRITLPDGTEISGAEWLAAWDAEHPRGTP